MPDRQSKYARRYRQKGRKRRGAAERQPKKGLIKISRQAVRLIDGCADADKRSIATESQWLNPSTIMTSKISKLAGPIFIATVLVFLVSGCMSSKTQSSGNTSPPTPQPLASATPAQSASPAPSPLPVANATIRIKAGTASPFTDSRGNVWAADRGFSGGDTIERPELAIGNTTEPGIYRSEHYSMDSFSCPLANGKYLVKLHFCETFEGIEGPGQRVFSFNVQGHEFKDFDVWAKAGGPRKAYFEAVPVDITNGKLLITFTSNIENPQINGIEITPQN
jgi:hypothetical protein